MYLEELIRSLENLRDAYPMSTEKAKVQFKVPYVPVGGFVDCVLNVDKVRKAESGGKTWVILETE